MSIQSVADEENIFVHGVEKDGACRIADLVIVAEDGKFRLYSSLSRSNEPLHEGNDLRTVAAYAAILLEM